MNPSSANIIPFHTHRRVRLAAAESAAHRMADHFNLPPSVRRALVADTRALVQAGRSAAWALSVARRSASAAADMLGHEG